MYDPFGPAAESFPGGPRHANHFVPQRHRPSIPRTIPTVADLLLRPSGRYNPLPPLGLPLTRSDAIASFLLLLRPLRRQSVTTMTPRDHSRPAWLISGPGLINTSVKRAAARTINQEMFSRGGRTQERSVADIGVFACASPLFLRGFIGRRSADTARHSSGVIAEKWRRTPWVLDRSVSPTMNSHRVLATSSRERRPFFAMNPREPRYGGLKGEGGLEFRW